MKITWEPLGFAMGIGLLVLFGLLWHSILSKPHPESSGDPCGPPGVSGSAGIGEPYSYGWKGQQ